MHTQCKHQLCFWSLSQEHLSADTQQSGNAKKLTMYNNTNLLLNLSTNSNIY